MNVIGQKSDLQESLKNCLHLFKDVNNMLYIVYIRRRDKIYKKMKIGEFIQQPGGYKAFIPSAFPPKKGWRFPSKLVQQATEAIRLIGKLDGITQLLPDVECFVYMYICKDAESSSQIEGTQATMLDAIEATARTSDFLPSNDVSDILNYIKGINYGLKRLKELPLSLRLIKEIHSKVMSGGRASHFSDPGNFRTSQNWIGGRSINEASFVPPPPFDLNRTLGDLENFFHADYSLNPLIKAGLIHAQFETIHPFLDGNGRTGRLLISLFLQIEGLLDRPVLFLSWYFKQHQQKYYQKLEGYHNGKVEEWLTFFIEGIIQTAEEAIRTVGNITQLREEDTIKIQSLGKTAAQSGLKVLMHLFKEPIINVSTIQSVLGCTRQGGQKIIDRFRKLGILELRDENKKYGRSFIYKRYVRIFYDHADF